MMTPEQESLYQYTLSHFSEIARKNRFPDNGAIDHDSSHCLICHPELVPEHPFAVYLEVITQSIKARRPRLDQELVEIINQDLELFGSSIRVTKETLLSGSPQSLQCWTNWARDAVATGLSLLSIHSPTSRDFDLDDEEISKEFGELIQDKIEEIMKHQRNNVSPA
jgi:hypothetical protein